MDEQLRDNIQIQMVNQPSLPLDGPKGLTNADGQLTVAPRHRRHQFPGRSRAIKVLYDEVEYAGVQRAAAAVG